MKVGGTECEPEFVSDESGNSGSRVVSGTRAGDHYLVCVEFVSNECMVSATINGTGNLLGCIRVINALPNHVKCNSCPVFHFNAPPPPPPPPRDSYSMKRFAHNSQYKLLQFHQ